MKNQKESKLMGLWTRCLEAKEAVALKLELSKSKASSKRAIVKLDEELIEAESKLIDLQTNLVNVESNNSSLFLYSKIELLSFNEV